MSELASEQLPSILAAANVGVWECDMISGKVSWTGDLYGLSGRSPDCFDGTLAGFLELVPPKTMRL